MKSLLVKEGELKFCDRSKKTPDASPCTPDEEINRKLNDYREMQPSIDEIEKRSISNLRYVKHSRDSFIHRGAVAYVVAFSIVYG